MPWVSLGSTTCPPGEFRAFTPPGVNNQPYLVVFPDFPESTVRYFGVWRWLVREVAPADTIVTSRYDKVVWHNGERIYIPYAGTGGTVRFYVPESFGSSLAIGMFRFE